MKVSSSHVSGCCNGNEKGKKQKQRTVEGKKEWKLSSRDALPVSAVLFDIHCFRSGLDEVLVLTLLQSQIPRAPCTPSRVETPRSVVYAIDEVSST